MKRSILAGLILSGLLCCSMTNSSSSHGGGEFVDDVEYLYGRCTKPLDFLKPLSRKQRFFFEYVLGLRHENVYIGNLKTGEFRAKGFFPANQKELDQHFVRILKYWWWAPYINGVVKNVSEAEVGYHCTTNSSKDDPAEFKEVEDRFINTNWKKYHLLKKHCMHYSDYILGPAW
ncbi:MAG: hypothetical protein F4227_07075 [Gammaproteobacteria bacterium]|nr:hypothetical protein [Gammaproteobacteria bacterium]MYF02720.1 hypothetical protein [Gammaproteobacteria bacterium]MYI77217.1 hypothetical protein [Gammaproteobacteria bacterium]